MRSAPSPVLCDVGTSVHGRAVTACRFSASTTCEGVRQPSTSCLCAHTTTGFPRRAALSRELFSKYPACSKRARSPQSTTYTCQPRHTQHEQRVGRDQCVNWPFTPPVHAVIGLGSGAAGAYGGVALLHRRLPP